ncbi:MAG: hypothetical protein L0Y71_08935 [Gemmataceae bacterium]|nr:hypothetical protein [Gemmataceae bacterium]
MALLAFLVAAAILCGFGYRLLRVRSGHEAAFHVMRCSACSQKVRYAPDRAGSTGLCPRCLRRLFLPETPPPLSKPILPCRVGERLSRKSA